MNNLLLKYKMTIFKNYIFVIENNFIIIYINV